MTRGRERVPLVAGDPRGSAPASFTRFLVPFAWEKHPCRSFDRSAPRFVRDAPPCDHADPLRIRDIARRRYFTPETSMVLYERATWLRLDPWPADCLRTVNFGDRPVALRIAPPRAVLFEYNGFARTNSKSGELLSTGFLVIEISFLDGNTTATLDDLAALNELLRFWREPFDGHRDRLRETPGGAIAHAETARALNELLHFRREPPDGDCDRTLQRPGAPIAHAETARALLAAEEPYTGAWEKLLRSPVCLDGSEPWSMVPEDSMTKARNWIANPSCGRDSGWICYTDERAFVYSCALTPRGARDLGHSGEDAEESGDWVRLLNVDAPSTALATEYEREWAEPRTFARWKHVGTLYGFSTHSAVMIGEPCEEPPTWRHFADMYFDQVLLLLYLRVTTFRFSAKLSTISTQLLGGKHLDRGRRRFEKLRREFAFFTNLYRFPLLSSQQQGIEMYALARTALDVDALFEEVQKEIESTHELYELVTAAKQQESANWLAWTATWAAAAGLALTLLGLEIGKEAADALQSYVDAAMRPPRPDARWIFFFAVTSLIGGVSIGIRSIFNSISERQSSTDQNSHGGLDA